MLIALMLAMAGPPATQQHASAAAARAQEPIQLDCIHTMKDQATGNCIGASSLPTFGMLLPIGPDLFVDPAGRVGIGTTTPAHELDVAGTIRSSAGGIQFPDGTLQTTATLQGPAGPPGALEPPLPTLPLGTVDLMSLIGGDVGGITVYDFELEAAPFGGIGSMTFSKDVDASTPSLLASATGGAPDFEAHFFFGDLTIELTTASVTDMEVRSADDLLPRETVTLSFVKILWEWDDGVTVTTADWDAMLNTGSGTHLSGANLTLAVPDQDPIGAGESEILEAATTIGAGVVPITRSSDELTPGFFHSAVRADNIGDTDVQIRKFSAGSVMDLPYFKMDLSTTGIDSVRLTRDPLTGNLVEEIELGYAAIAYAFTPL